MIDGGDIRAGAGYRWRLSEEREWTHQSRNAGGAEEATVELVQWGAGHDTHLGAESSAVDSIVI